MVVDRGAPIRLTQAVDLAGLISVWRERSGPPPGRFGRTTTRSVPGPRVHAAADTATQPRRMPAEPAADRFLELVGADVASAAYDDVLFPPGDIEVAFGQVGARSPVFTHSPSNSPFVASGLR